MTEIPAERPSVTGNPLAANFSKIDPITALSRGRAEGQAEDPTVTEMKHNRRVNAKRAQASTGGTNLSFATGRPTDPMFYWKQNNLPYDTAKTEDLTRIREYCRILYQTHPVVASATDIYSKYPLTGMELQCKDDELTEFYSTLFFDQLNYEEYLIDVGREYWVTGEAWPLGTWNDTLGVWEDDELIPPDDITVTRSPFLKEPRFHMRVPEVIRQILETRQPAYEFQALMASYPELANFAGQNDRMPVSNVLLKQIAFKADTFHPRGLPILLRGFRAIMQEEMLNAAQDAVASRLYTPLILAKLGASASDLGTQSPWIPTEDDLQNFEDSLDSALAADFRVLTHHFAVNMESVFGRENMPNFDQDFDRLTGRILQVYGLSQTMLSGAEAGKTYASDSINRDLVSQLLTSYQRKIKQFFRSRALVVAEAQEHFDYEVRGGIRYPIMEEVLEVDPESGVRRIVEKPKLLVPDLHIKAMTMADEQDERQFIEAMRASGVPVSMKTRLTNTPIKLDEEIDKTRDEQVQMAVEAQETRKATYEALRSKGLPIPTDLLTDFQPKASVVGSPPQPATPAGDQVLPSLGTQQVNDAALVPSPADVATQIQQQDAASQTPEPAAAASNVVQLPRPKVPSSVPPESNDQRASMPKPASLVGIDDEGRKYTQILSSKTTGEGDEARTVDEWSDKLLGDVDMERSSLLNGPAKRRVAYIRNGDGELLGYDPLNPDGPTRKIM